MVSFVGSLSANWQSSSTKEIAQQVAREIRFDLDAYRKLRTATEAFGYLKNKIEQTGVFVFFLSNLGSYHTDILVSAFRGFALSDPRAPCIVVNSKDSHFARVFTLLHELVHLWIGDTGISGAISGDLIAVEQFCNHVASEVLLPESALAYEIVAYEIDKIVQEKYPLSTLGLLSNKFNISKRMIVHRLWQAGHIDESTWLYLCEKLEEYWEDPRLKQGDQDVIMSTRLKIKETVGVGAMDLLAWGLRKNFISPVKAGTVVGQNPYAASRVLLDDAVHMNDPEYVWD
ncbi:MAG: ImmA/IrrE family metallo-endopeptidase [Alphaproteobacteria bacterium]|nr:ImmA/IrrE family metallo-endopeptidase [Alphaproteobacteria bacterium]